MSRWPTRNLGELVRFVGGGTPSRDRSEYWNGTIPWASVKDLQDLDIDNTIETITDEGLRQSATNLIPPNTVVMASRVGLGKVGITQRTIAINQDLKALIPQSGDILPRYLLYYLVAIADQIDSAGVGATVRGVTLDYLSKLKVPLAPLKAQQQIFQALDEARAIHRRGKQSEVRLKALAPSVFFQLFGDPEVNSHHWPIVPVSSFVSRFQSGRSVGHAGDEGNPSEYRILKVSAVTWGKFQPEESRPVPAWYVPSPEQIVRQGDLLFSRANTTELVGATVFVDTTPPKMLLPDKLWRFVWLDPSSIEPRFVLALFQHPWTRRELANRSTGTGGSMKNLSMDKVLSMEVPMPPTPIQREFSNTVVKVNEIQLTQSKALQRIEDLFRSLLHDSFEGTV